MSDRYLDDCLPVIAIDIAVEEKTRVAEMAATTLHKLHNVIRQIKNWRDDSAKLKSNIWRMKMALRADDKNGNDNQEIDPLIMHQRTEISRLEQANDALGNEVASLKSALTRAEEDIVRITGHRAGDERAEDGFSSDKKREQRSNETVCRKQHPQEEAVESHETRVVLRQLGDRLEEFARGDRVFEVMLVNAIGKVVETVVHLSEELVNVNEDLHRFKTKNRNLHRKLDRLKAMLRSRCGNSAEYRKRIGELNKLAEQLAGQMDRLSVIRENATCEGSSNAADVLEVVTHVGRLMNDLKDNLKSEREAMIAAGDPDRLRYMKKVVDLKVSLRVLAAELRRSNSSSLSSMHKRSLGDERCTRTTSLLDDLLKEIDIEIGKLKITSMDKYYRIGGVSGSRYTTKVAELEDAVRNSTTVIAALRRRGGATNVDGKATQELGDSIERLCREMKELEVFDDRASLRERIGRLEVSIVRLRLQLAEKNDRVSALSDECASLRSTLENERNKHEEIAVNVRRENERLREDTNRWRQEIAELSRERVHLEQRVVEMRPMTVEIDALRKELQELRDDKETLSGELERMCNDFRERDKEIASIIAGRDLLKADLGAEVKELKMKLGMASDENVKLKSIIGGLGKRWRRRERQRLDKLKSSVSKSDDGRWWRRRRDNGEGSREDPKLRDEFERLKAESNESKISSNEANGRADRLKRALDEALGDRAKLQTEVSDLKSNEESLTYRLNARTSAGEEAARECERVTEVNKALESEVKHLRNEKEQLGTELSELRAEKGLLARSTDDANNKCAVLQDQVNKFREEREAAMENLKFELERARTELEDAAVKVARLKAENTRLASDLDALSAAQNAETDERVRVLLAGKNELTTRINELGDENASLRDRLNKARTENEYFSMELNKSRVESDKVAAKNALLQVTCDIRASENEALRRERDQARRRLNETDGTFDDRRKIRRAEAPRTAATLRRESNDRVSHSRRIDTRYPLTKGHGFADAYNKVRRHKQDCSNAARTGIKVEIGEQKDDETAFKAESDTCASPDNKAKIKDEPKGGLKRSRIENKALKSEQANLGPENVEVAMELACAADESESPILLATGELRDGEGIIDFVSKRRDLANICYTRRISNYANHSGNFQTLRDKGRLQVSDIDQLQVESRALKMEVDTLRGDLDFSLTDCGRSNLAMAEIRALKSELMSLRNERATLRLRLEAFEEESDELKSERTALKDELVASRKSNFDLRLKVNDLRSAVEKLKGTNAKLEDGLRHALKETSEHNVTSHNSSADIFQSIAEENSLAIAERLSRLEYDPANNSRLETIKGDLQHVKTQK
ncbi:cingulin-like [Odontomachus brunneus]|uniref:cingulin-like n=1 Tax=Odontomachus brunneus TaxID=486640 RepID=UPI0013F1D09E|nr:cingulin-like [Odontomachus brunneus]XP_032670894.1 cingulin-like [Odontomachus brunneus]